MASELLGVAALTRQLRDLGALDKGNVIRAAVKSGSAPMLAAARAAAPERTSLEGGALRTTYKGQKVAPGFGRRSVKAVTILSRDKQMAAALIGVAPEAFYMVQFVELGTSRQAPQPWLVPAHAATQSSALQKVSASLFRAMVRIAKKGKGGAP